MTFEEIERICMGAVRLLRWLAPKDTGNLAYNAIKFEWVSKSKFKIYIDERIAPYMVYTNEEWLSDKWHGKKNPNEGWFDNAVEIVARYFAQQFKGVLKNG